ncbi:MAG: type I 3-dehydroquinate dehydratase [Fibrobacteres bacterium]|nr:type I 3-dehydroquinate dehydratase [Fibrobacterota bacterium]
MNLNDLAIGKIKLHTGNPKIIAVLDSYISSDELKHLYSDGAVMVEIRFDLLPGEFDQKLEFAETVRNSAPFGIIGTLRENENNKNERDELVILMSEYVDAIDEEVSYPTAAANLERCVGKVKIVSHHDFNSTPSESQIAEWVSKCISTGADIVKLAFKAKTKADVLRIKEFAQSLDVPAILIAMGEAGFESRKNPAAFNSLATYAFSGAKAVAPGQLSVKEIAAFMKAGQ